MLQNDAPEYREGAPLPGFRPVSDAWGISAHGEVQATAALRLETGGKGRRYLLTSAQSNTGIHAGFWGNLHALADHHGTEIMVVRIRYNHSEAQLAQEKVNRAAETELW